ncbi:MAG: enoyl-CoA hydratase [bacterium]|nr:enoyl-CoA hydratase [Gammaproteobacteria bacterium]HIL97305.1 enoyl-CoA hydratase [Pseudomonadales bacterium]
MSDVLIKETIDYITTVTLNRPEHLNALSSELRQVITETFVALKDDPGTRVIILTGSGRAFSAGLDLKELGKTGLDSSQPNQPVDNTARVQTDLHDALRSVGKPLIGAINGFAITGGFEIALMCDILVASTQAKFADTHVRMGVVPGWGLSQRLAQLIGSSRAKELSFTGNYLDAETAERWGLVNRILEPEDLLPHCQQLARDICSVDPATLKTVHKLIDFGWEHTLGEGLFEEKTRNTDQNGDISPAALDQRRSVVMSRGRDQTGS